MPAPLRAIHTLCRSPSLGAYRLYLSPQQVERVFQPIEGKYYVRIVEEGNRLVLAPIASVEQRAPSLSEEEIEQWVRRD